MDKTAVKNYAIWARTKLIEDIKYKASLLGITEKVIADALPQSTTQEQYFDIGTREPYAIRGVHIAQRRSLAEAIKKKAQESDYLTAYNSIIEEVAYTWFNRFIAVRFMEVNDYLPCKIRVLSAVDGRQEPDIVQNPFDAKLDYTSAEEELISQHQMNNEGDKLFNMLFVKVCNDLSKVLPQLFEVEQDYTELLLNISYTDQDGLIYKLVHDIPEDNFDVNAVDEEGKSVGQVEIIGWLYQYYNTELNDTVYDGSYAKKKLSKEWIPAATTIYTPDWVVKYMVENSLGRLWCEGHPESTLLKENWKYYLDEAQQEEAVQAELAKIKEEYAKLRPEDIKVIDPCMGSGHILVYAFDVLMQIYTQVGYTDKDATISILENNLYGLDIDKRAFQLAYFAVLMKARQYHKFILKKQPQCHIYAIAESNGINMKHLAYFGAQLDELARPVALNQMQELIATLHDAKEYGSIISVADYDWDLLHQFAAEFDVSGEMNLFDSFGIEATQQRLQELVAVGEVLAQKYEVVVTNPPYLGSSRFNDKLDAYVKEHFKDEKSDLSMVMYRQSLDSYSVHNGLVAFITTSSWMFLSSFEKLRRYIMQNKSFVSIVDFGSELFEGKVGHNVITSWITRNAQIDANLLGIRLVEYCYSRRNEKITEFHNRRNWHYVKQSNFAKIPGTPVAYWVSENVIDLFGKNKISDIASAKSGMTTTNNERFLRFWFEVEIRRIGFGYKSIDDTVDRLYKWFPFCKGGDFRRWAGNECYVVNWFNNGEEIRKAAQGASGGRLVNIDCALQKSIVWTKISSSIICLRYKNTGLFFSDAAPGLFSDDEKLMYILGLMNTKYAMKIINLINPTLNFVPGTIASIPIIDGLPCISEVKQLVKQNISLSKSDWDAFETSWDFTKHPLLRNKLTISEAYSEWEAECNTRFAQLKANEEELNRIFIDIYGLQDELTPEVEDKDVTVRKADLQRDIKSLLSYAVGCMFGRYSLDVEGLAYAGGEWDESKYVTFKPDEDNVIPITDEDYFEDDIIGRLIAWLKVVYGAETLEENLRFIADALGTSGDTARQKIRNYFLKDFFKDHCKIYQKRPIYWLYDSGRQNGFKALIYMHRYDADTSGQVRAEYLGKMEETYESEINRMQDIMDNGAGREVALAGKRKEKLQKQLHECRDYDAVLGHIALASIAIDLDDGVKVNYVKVQTAKDGKLLPILAKI
ncbi:BREX-1 system adenine-specific DNA-methyltransferase PglX [Phascolarctobacterium succinatutens]|uniref:BREX-1 system adenine-specific DNA-methyltransferase PglX n=1 Tax=Phascolarctobacterium succinatutens TaxID=626940 RepID=UPI0026F179A1|nr:BREX-1 system adenine-specific DNA-methyltransferase PglX [Phascolarctobacterium succinatutens]MBS5426408.1 BREX-1 system adenine-specific DNA-methyltransferase PglX [Phascolarctobacterium succinatutens]